jgi:hypothetical protein
MKRTIGYVEDSATAHRCLVDAGVHPLRAARAVHSLSIDKLSAETGLAARTIIRAEAGQPVNAQTCYLLTSYFGMEACQLGLVYRHAHNWRTVHGE